MARFEHKWRDCISINEITEIRKQGPLSKIAIDQLETIPVVRRALFGFGALVAVIPIAFFGMILILAPVKNLPIMLLQRLGLGGGLLTAAIFMLLVSMRLWFGKIAWVDHALRLLFPRAYVFLLVGVCVLFTFVVLKIQAGR